MPEVLANLYQVTGSADHLVTAQQFDHAAVLNPLAGNQDQLPGLHANTQIPKMIAAALEYELTGESRYYDIARTFWRQHQQVSVSAATRARAVSGHATVAPPIHAMNSRRCMSDSSSADGIVSV